VIANFHGWYRHNLVTKPSCEQAHWEPTEWATGPMVPIDLNTQLPEPEIDRSLTHDRYLELAPKHWLASRARIDPRAPRSTLTFTRQGA
jgi:hypothetical protein